jgi:hypothetical protein
MRIDRERDGSMRLTSTSPTSSVTLSYAVQRLDWIARALAGTGLLLVMTYPLAVHRGGRDSYHVASRESSAVN